MPRLSFHAARRVALILCALTSVAFFTGCEWIESYQLPLEIEPPPIYPERRVLDYRNGWFHSASGEETIQQIGTTYHRDPELVALLNQFGVDDVPDRTFPVYVPPVNDRKALRVVLAWINEHPESVPQTPPPLDKIVTIRRKRSSPTPHEPMANQPILPTRTVTIEGRLIPIEVPPPPESTESEIASAEKIGVDGAQTSPTPPDRTIPEVEDEEKIVVEIPPSAVDLSGESETVSTEEDLNSNIGLELKIRSGRRRNLQPPGKFNWPIEGVIVKKFSADRSNPFRGIAIAAAQNAPVYASREGKVIFASELKGYGKSVIIDHGDGFISVYGYNHDLFVKKDQSVRAGDEIASVGQPSKWASHQLFFQIRKDARPMDPMDFLP